MQIHLLGQMGYLESEDAQETASTVAYGVRKDVV
jgi:hypothetical protein